MQADFPRGTPNLKETLHMRSYGDRDPVRYVAKPIEITIAEQYTANGIS